MEHFAQSELLWRLVIATVLGALLGFERSIAGKHAGMRTYALVALGSCLFVSSSVLAAFELLVFPGVNPLYIAASVVVGIGFIGAGLSGLRLPGQGQDGQHPELTTATGVWVAAGVGMAVGFGLYTLAVTATILGLLIFWLLAKVERKLQVRFRTYQGGQ